MFIFMPNCHGSDNPEDIHWYRHLTAFFIVEKGMPGFTVEKILISLGQQRLVKLYRDKGGVQLAKATYERLKKAHPLEHYRWFPLWVDKRRKF